MMISVRAEVLSQFERVTKEQNKKLLALTEDVRLLDTGLDSLCFAVLLASPSALLSRHAAPGIRGSPQRRARPSLVDPAIWRRALTDGSGVPSGTIASAAIPLAGSQ